MCLIHNIGQKQVKLMKEEIKIQSFLVLCQLKLAVQRRRY